MKSLFLGLVLTTTLVASEAHAQITYNGDGFLIAALAPPFIGSAISDVGVIASLVSGPDVRLGWSVTGTVFGGVNTLIGGFWLYGALIGTSGFGLSSRYLIAPSFYLLYGAASLGLCIYGISKRPGRNEPEVGLAPFVPAPRGGVAPGFAIAGRF